MLRRLTWYVLLAAGMCQSAWCIVPVLSVRHGIYSDAFRLSISSPVAGSTLYYTDDGSDPREKGQLYDGALLLSSTTVIRAASLSKDSTWSDVATASYIFPKSLLTQDNKPAGYPAYWGKYCQISGTAIADYEMDPEIVAVEAYASLVLDGISSLPIVSLVTDRDHLFSRETNEQAGGIYIFTGCPVGDGTGRGWERPVSFEFIGGQQQHDLTVDCALKLHGGHGRLPEKNPKHAFRLHFKADYGPKKLKYAVFGNRAPNRFNALVLRTFFGYSWLHWDNAQRQKAQYARDIWARETQARLGDPISTGQYVHLFINGLYWGMYNLCERVAGDFCSEHFGGVAEDWDVTEVDGGAGKYHAAQPVEGDTAAWNKMADLIYTLPSHRNYMQLVGLDAEGKHDDNIPPLLDVDNFIHFMLINLYGGNTDWDHHNWFAYRNRIWADQGFRFICWDTENIFVSPTEDLTSKNNRGCPTGFMNQLMKQGIFAHRFHEEAQRLLTHGGALTPEAARQTWDSLANVIHLALWDEAARWGDYRRDVHPYTSKGVLYKPDDAYATEQKRLREKYFPFRTATLLQQLRNRGWFPKTEAPAIFVDEAEVGYGLSCLSVGNTLTMSGRNIYYTTDGSAPVSWFRSDAGTLSLTAKAYVDGQDLMSELAESELADTLTLRAICKNGTEWSPIVSVRLALDSPTGIRDVARSRVDAGEKASSDAPGNAATQGIFDLQGRPIAAKSLRKGLFIINGKKRYVK